MSSWHSKPLPRLLEELDVRPGGLSQHQAEERLRRAGPNELEPPPQAGLLGRLLEQLRDHQERHRQAELDARQCLSGPHKDDLLVELDGRSAKTYGSQGQTRTAALSLKLAQRDIFFQETGEYPVLLLDDVLSELDARRQAFVLNHIQGGQIFITCCEEEKLEGLDGGAAFHIHGGALV